MIDTAIEIPFVRRSPRPPTGRAAQAFLLLTLLGAGILALGGAGHHAASPTQARGYAANFAQLPLSFAPNVGQTDSGASFTAQGAGYGLRFGDRGPELSLSRRPVGAAMAIRFLGAAPHPKILGLDKLPGTVNYLTGARRASWHTGIPTFARVRYQDPWPGVSVDFYGRQPALEYDIRLAAGADPGLVRLGFAGAESIQTDHTGALLIKLPGGTVRQPSPFAYQRGADGRTSVVQSSYVLLGAKRVGLRLGAYDASRPLTVDPTLAYSTYLGGSATEFGNAIALDSSGSIYVTGGTDSANFPTQGPVDTRGAVLDAFVSKLNPAGTALTYSTYLAGSDVDAGYGLAVDASGEAFVTGQTRSTDFPTQSPFQAANAGGFADEFVAKLNAQGSALLYSTYLGGSGQDIAQKVAVDASGNAYVAGSTGSTNFPTANPLQAAKAGGDDVAITKLNPSGALVYSTYLGGTSTDIGFGLALDGSNNIYLSGYTTSTNFPTTPSPLQSANAGGRDVFATKLNAAGSSLLYSTYLGGTDDDEANGIAVDGSGNLYLGGDTYSTNFPTLNPAQGTSGGSADGFAATLNPAGTALSYSTYLGGTGSDVVHGVAVGTGGDLYLTGETNGNFPTLSPVQATYGGLVDGFVTRLSPTGSLFYSTYLGGSDTDRGFGIAIDTAGTAFVTGDSFSPNFPTTPSSFQAAKLGSEDVTISKISTLPPRSTTTALTCAPTSVAVGVATACTAAVTDTGTGTVSFPTSTVSFSSSSPGTFAPATTCTLAPTATQGTSSCTVSYTPSALGSGIHALSAAYGGGDPHTASSGQASVTVTAVRVDPPALMVPQTMITKLKLNQKKRSAKFIFKGTNSPTGFTCALAKTTKKKKPALKFRPCRSPKTYKRLKPGTYIFAVRASNAAGADPSPARKKFKVKKPKPMP